MSPSEVANIRSSLGLTQAQLAQLLGVHPLTVSKWERGVATPTPHQAAMLQSFKQAAAKQPGIGEVVAGVLVGAGLGLALYHLLKAAFGNGEGGHGGGA